jgi:hypothetical protein
MMLIFCFCNLVVKGHVTINTCFVSMCIFINFTLPVLTSTITILNRDFCRDLWSDSNTIPAVSVSDCSTLKCSLPLNVFSSFQNCFLSSFKFYAGVSTFQKQVYLIFSR